MGLHQECHVLHSYPMYKRDSEALKRVQLRAMKVLCNLSDLSYPEGLRGLKLPTLMEKIRSQSVRHIDDLNYTKFFKLAEGYQTICVI